MSDDPPQPSRYPGPYRSFQGRNRVPAAALGGEDAEPAVESGQAEADGQEDRPEGPVA
ncbi:hypothetical protein GCM10009527_077740 [Actinomadura nitritigenes]|uniref:Uncharacterized protein n=1 Tax=Actinomadura nitritigenes TaxID=134602 RepID=A0ABS3R3C8_9ACTN|nr:hypothetical protein [Actinomadura nitritigenes]MBO2440522.1 hypothetical protein [Actinomadura nitritigenes]